MNRNVAVYVKLVHQSDQGAMKEILTYLDSSCCERCVLDCVRLRWDAYLPLLHMRRLRCGQRPKRLKMRHETKTICRLQKGRLQGRPRLRRYPLAKLRNNGCGLFWS